MIFSPLRERRTKMRNIKNSFKTLRLCALAILTVSLVAFLLPDTAMAKSGKPEKVTDISIELTESNTHEVSFRPVEGAYKYQYVVSDGENEYANTFSGTAPNVVIDYMEFISAENVGVVSFTIDSSLSAINNTGFMEDGSGNFIHADDPEVTYFLKVRAVNKDNENLIYGDWSDAVSYVGNDWKGVTRNLKYVGYEDGLHHFTYEGDINKASDVTLFASSKSIMDQYDIINVDNSRKGHLYVTDLDMSIYDGHTVYFACAYDTHNIKDSFNNNVFSNVVELNVDCNTKDTAPDVVMTIENKGFSRLDAVFEQIDAKEAAYTNLTYEVSKVIYSDSPSFATSEEFTNFSGGYFYCSTENLKYDTKYYAKAIFTCQYRDYVIAATEAELEPHRNDDITASIPVSEIYFSHGLNAFYYSKDITVTDESDVEEFVIRNPFGDTPAVSLRESNNEIEFYLNKQLTPSERMLIEISESADFNAKPTNKILDLNANFGNNSYMAPKASFIPKTLYYVRARIIKYGELSDPNGMEDYAYSPWSKVVSFKTDFVSHTLTATYNTKKGVTLTSSNVLNSCYEGMELQKKKGSKFTTIYKGSMFSYSDTGLKANETATYRSRLYVYNESTKKFIYSDWKCCAVTNWKASFVMSAVPKSKSSVSLTWTKLSDAAGYEIYRTSPFTYANLSSKKVSMDTYTLIKSVGRSQKSYVDKKLNAKSCYKYLVKAYKVVNGKKLYISSYDSVSLNFFDPVEIKNISRSNTGKTTVIWKKAVGAKNYVIEKYDATLGTWVTYKSTSKTKYVFDAFTPESLSFAENANPVFRILAVNGDKISYSEEFSIDAFLSAPKSVTAKVMENGKVKISWSKVEDADYYRISRNEKEIDVCVPDSTDTYGYKVTRNVEEAAAYDMYLAVTDETGYENVLCEGPEGGRYVYTVTAYKKIGTNSYWMENETASIHSEAKAGSAVNVSSTKLAIPSISKLSAKSGKVTIKWNSVSGANGYEILRSTKKSSGYSVIATITKGTTLSYTDKKAQKGKTYYYKIRSITTSSVGDRIESALSKYKSVKAK